MPRSFLKSEALMGKDTAKKRLHLLDYFRGIAFVNMAIYHALFLLDDMYNIRPLPDLIMEIYQNLICSGFILISGAALSLMKKSGRDILKLVLAAAAVSVATYIATPEYFISFGILHFFSLALIIGTAVKPLLYKIPPLFGAALNLLLFTLFYAADDGYGGIFALRLFDFPDALYNFPLSFVFGFPSPTYTSGDYFGLIPWIFLYFAGFFIFRIIRENKKALDFFYKNPKPYFLSFFGRNSLIFYLIHQPIIYAVLYVIFKIIR